MNADREQIRALAGRMNDAQVHAGVLASVVADYLALDDLEAARAALPAYIEARAAEQELGTQMVHLAGLGALEGTGS